MGRRMGRAVYGTNPYLHNMRIKMERLWWEVGDGLAAGERDWRRAGRRAGYRAKPYCHITRIF